MNAKLKRVDGHTPDFIAYCALRIKLWPMDDATNHREAAAIATDHDRWAVFIARLDGLAIGFVEAHLRDYAEGASSSPVGFIEGWYVAPEARRHGIGRALMLEGERWARDRGCVEMASDTQADNIGAIEAHQRIGYQIAERLVSFLKRL